MSELDSPVPGVRVLRQDNAGPMTLEGTQSYVIEAPGGAVVIDPGDDDAAHQEALAALGPVALIIVTHRHHDHVGGLARLRALTGATSRGAAEEFSVGSRALHDGERLALGGGVELRVLATPGHTSDSISLVLGRDGVDTAVFTGDTILGHGTTIIDHPDGTLGDYLDSLETLKALGPVTTLPAHGGFPGPVDALAQQYLSHRLMRLEQVSTAAAGLRERGLEPTVSAVTDIVYAEVDPSVRGAAEHTVSAQLALLARRGQI